MPKFKISDKEMEEGGLELNLVRTWQDILEGKNTELTNIIRQALEERRVKRWVGDQVINSCYERENTEVDCDKFREIYGDDVFIKLASIPIQVLKDYFQSIGQIEESKKYIRVKSKTIAVRKPQVKPNVSVALIKRYGQALYRYVMGPK